MADAFTIDKPKIAKAVSLLTALYNEPSEQTYLRAKQLVDDSAEIKTDLQAVRADTVEKVPTIFYDSKTPWLDKWIVGVRRGELILVGGWPYSGKTHFMVWLDSQYPGAKTAHFYVEDLPQDMLRYYEKSRPGSLQDVWFVDMKETAFTIGSVERIVHQQTQAGVKPDIVVLDHLDVMHSTATNSGNDWLDASTLVKEVKAFARRQDVIVIAGSLAYPKTSDRMGMGRFYRAPVAKAHVADIVFMIDKVDHGDYYITREKAKGREVGWDDAKKILKVDWGQMIIEDTSREDQG
jgi:hypothetical protein